MNQAVFDRLFGVRFAFDHPVTTWTVVLVGAALLAAPVMVAVICRWKNIERSIRSELMARIGSWAVLAPLILGPILLGAAWTILAVSILSLLCYREYARATGLFRQKMVSTIVVVGIVLITFATVDHWYGLFVALGPLVVLIIAAVAILADQPKGYIQRVALAVFGFLLFGVCLGHLGYFANDAHYRPILAMLILGVELNDVFAYLAGKTLGRSKLCPNTSPNKTIGGAVGALILTTVLMTILGHFVYRGTGLDSIGTLITLGLIVSLGGQLGDLMVSSIKRDIGIKDIGKTLPGHGGLLDRFDSLLLVAPAAFHYVGYFRGIGLDQVPRIITTGAGWN